MNRPRRLLILLSWAAIPLLVSQLLPADNPDRWSPIAVVLLLAAGVLAGWAAPTVRGWMATVAWTVVGSALILLSWTDLVLDVRPSILSVETWRNEAFVAIAAALAIVSVGIVAGALVGRRGVPPPVRPAVRLSIAATAVIALATSGLVAVAFARSSIVVQPDAALVTVVVTDTGLEVSPATIDDGTYQLIYESRATRRVVVTGVVPLDAGDGVARAMTTAEVDAWLAGSWETLGPPFSAAATWQTLGPGERRYGGLFQARPSSDGSGGTLWYMSAVDALRQWPGETGEAEPALVPWPIDQHFVQPVRPR